MAKGSILEEAVNNKYNTMNKAISEQEAVMTKNKSENRGRRRIYKTNDAVKNINGYIYLVDYEYLCKLSYTLEKTQTNLINSLLEDLYKYLETPGKSFDTMGVQEDQILQGRETNSCVKVNLRLFKDVHAKYVEYRKESHCTIADFFAAVMDLHAKNNPGLKLKKDIYLENAIKSGQLKIVSMKGNARFRKA